MGMATFFAKIYLSVFHVYNASVKYFLNVQNLSVSRLVLSNYHVFFYILNVEKIIIGSNELFI